MLRIFLEFLAFFAIILITGYVLPAGHYYWMFHIRKSPAKEKRKIQNRVITRAQIQREVKLSVITCFIFAIMFTGLFQMWKAGMTGIYLNFTDYPLWYFPISVLLCFVFHDTFFYWSHRFMHWRPVFKYLHLGHHKSVSPTPWAIYAFQPGEAIIQGLGIMAMVLLIPMHPLALFIFLYVDTQVNTAGHCGYECVPRFIAKSPFYWGLNTVRHHDNHHTNLSKNFGSFFNIWDRMMGTFLDDDAAEEEVPAHARPPEDDEREIEDSRKETASV